MRLNLDAGELPDESPELWTHFDILNIACGGHAGDTTSMTRVVEFCIAHSIAIGAHPSYPDREHFGRRSLRIDPMTLRASLMGQLLTLDEIARARGARLHYVKPHGALYHDASRAPVLARIVVDAIRTALGDRATIIGPRGHLETTARAVGFSYAIEGFADRAMHPDGTLVPRTEPNALITSPSAAAAQARSLSNVDTICVHADTPGSIEIARAVRAALSNATSNAPVSQAPSPNAPPRVTSTRAEFTFVALGDRAIRFARPPSVSTRALVDAIKRWAGVSDVVVARRDVAAYFATPFVSPSLDLEQSIADLANVRDLGEAVREIEIHATYDGADLDDVARVCGLTTDEVIRAHADRVYEVDTLGFAPGFAYLVGLDARLHVPRRATPRSRVPAGALAIGGEYTAIYPFTSPGGWNLIGRVEEKMFDLDRGARLQLGDRVRFTR